MDSSIESANRHAASLARPVVAALVATVLGSLVIGCVGATGGSSGLRPVPTDQGTRPSGPASIPPSAGTEPGAVPQPLVEQVVADAAALAGVDPSTVVVVSTESVTWNNGALGCPKPGVMYIDQIINGYKVVVEAGGKRYDYRAGSSGDPKLCEGSFPVGGST